MNGSDNAGQINRAYGAVLPLAVEIDPRGPGSMGRLGAVWDADELTPLQKLVLVYVASEGCRVTDLGHVATFACASIGDVAESLEALRDAGWLR